MDAVIINDTKTFTLYGCSQLRDQNKTYSEIMFELLDQLWEEVKNKKLSHKGISHVVYDVVDDIDHIMFVGIELNSPPEEDLLLEKKVINLEKYAYCKHIGPYSELDKSYKKIHSIIEDSGEQSKSPQIEIYGHWNEDESKLETEIIFNLE